MAVKCAKCHKLVEEKDTELRLYKRKGRMAIYRPVCAKCCGFQGNIFDKLRGKF